jgi:hypothetical protein
VILERALLSVVLVPAILALAGACQPTVKLVAPEEPIVIDINIKIEQDVRVKVEREIDDLLRENEDLF